MPASVRGWWIICSSTLKGTVAISAPARAQSVIWMGLRTEAAMISVWMSGVIAEHLGNGLDQVDAGLADIVQTPQKGADIGSTARAACNA